VAHAAGVASSAHAVRLSIWTASAIAACWLLATLYRAVGLAIAWRHVRSVRRRATPLTLDRETLAIGSGRRPIVCTSPDVDSPMVVGFIRPVMLLPEWLIPALSTEEFRQIALHECEHLRRRDDWTNLFLQLGLTLFPLNPALLWLNRRIGVQRELACDAAVVAAASRPVDYAASLARIAEQHLRRNKLRFALAAWGRESELSYRIQTLLSEPQRWSVMQRAGAVSAMGVLLLGCAVGIAHMPQLISVEAPAAMALTRPDAAGLSLPPHVAAPVLASNLDAGRGVHFERTSYVARAAVQAQRLTVHRVRTAQRRSERQYVEATATLARPAVSPFRMTRASAGAEPFRAAAQAHAPARAVTAFYSPTYLAVPVSDGWLIIQL
jgi:beta-lactamase regulating signal transducer with metallopeptidase domain